MKVELLSITPDAEKLIENAGRTAYLSFDRLAERSEERFIRMLIRSGHLSVLEHASATIRVRGASRVFTHQLVRHRLCSYTQQSQRHVDEKAFTFVVPETIANDATASELFTESMEYARRIYMALLKLGVPHEDCRYVLPNATESQIVITANMREWRHIFELRGSSAAQLEIRQICIEILRVLKSHAPGVFQDMEIDDAKHLIVKHAV